MDSCNDSAEIYVPLLTVIAITLQDAHPSWNCTPSSQHLIAEAERTRPLQSSAVVREQDLHRAAAAQQLETLERIEEGRPASSLNNEVSIGIDVLCVQTQAPADAGAGSFRRG